MMIDLKNLTLPTLSKGNHPAGSKELCIMEAVAFVEREPHSDMPACASPVVARFLQGINDHIPDARRHELWRFVTRIAGTASPEFDQQRADFLAMKAVNVFAVMACEGVIDDSLLSAMRGAQTLVAADAAANAAADAANAAYAANAYAAARAAANAANAAYDTARAAARAAAYAAYAANAAYDAARATARAAANAANAAARADVWTAALAVIDELLDIGPAGRLTHPERLELLCREFTE